MNYQPEQPEQREIKDYQADYSINHQVCKLENQSYYEHLGYGVTVYIVVPEVPTPGYKDSQPLGWTLKTVLDGFDHQVTKSTYGEASTVINAYIEGWAARGETLEAEPMADIDSLSYLADL